MSIRTSKPTKKPGRQGVLLGVLIVVCVLGVAYLIDQGVIDLSRFGIGPTRSGSSSGSVATPAGDLQVFFTTPNLVYPDVAKNRTPPPYEQAIIADIDAATRNIDMATFEYNLRSIADALVRAKQRGVQVRVALDRESLDDPAMSAWAGMLEDAHISVSWQESDAFLHSKFIVVDGRLVWTGSWNATINDTYRNNNNLLRISLPVIVANYQAEFAQMATGSFSTSKHAQTPNPIAHVGDVQIETYFSPQDGVQQHIVSWINQANQNIDVLAFSFTSDAIGNALIARRQAGVSVRGVFEKRNAQGIGSEFDRLFKAKIDVLTDSNCYTMHHKVIIIDQRVVITGSYNFTGRAEDVNDENLLIIVDPAMAKLYMQEFERVYRQAQNPTVCN
ncbi:MAG: DUF1669 domain-containing protein [Oscillochloris sp.]|nr:DUF1669 domain-containing protein [Oscillochloris sp.]